MARYKLLKNSIGIWGVYDKEDGGQIPFDEGNRHYQEYLKWVENGNTAEAAD
tara:strand:+ start:461 stop:616 length:156 start_codon:yes stop_codon:yes gene_type:complete